MKVYTTLDDVAKLLQAGRVGVIPTDTIYGLAACADNQGAVERLYELKQREGKPGTIIAASIDQLVELGLKRRYLTAVEHYWPGQISVLIPCSDLSYLHLGLGSVAVRIPDDKKLRTFLEHTGALMTTSANHTNQPAAMTIKEAQNYFNEEVDFYVDGGDASGRAPSTVIRIVDDAVEIVREGAVKLDEAGRIIT